MKNHRYPVAPTQRRRIALVLFAVVFLSFTSHSQHLPTPSRLLDEVVPINRLPEGLLKDRSVLVLSAQPDARGMLDPARTHAWAQALQPMFAEQGVDVVACFQKLVLLAGREPWAAFEELWANRGLRYLIWVQEHANGAFTVSVSELPEAPPLLASPMQAYQLSASSLESLITDFRREIIRADLGRENFMVLEHPEFFSDVPMITKSRYESFPMDLRLDKIAIRWPEGVDENLKQALGMHLDSIYPYQFDFVDINQTDRQIQNDGFQYVLDWVYAPGLSLRQVFNYEINEGENTYITFMTIGPNQKDIKSIAIYVPVYKFYMRHLITGDIYLGTEWDADTEWTEALKHFCFSFRNFVMSG